MEAHAAGSLPCTWAPLTESKFPALAVSNMLVVNQQVEDGSVCLSASQIRQK